MRAPFVLSVLGALSLGATSEGANAAATLPAVSSIVRVESGADVLGAGFVLESDRRVLTSLSSLGGRKVIQVRYITGQLTESSIVLTDVSRDLVLLEPKIKLPVGLRPSSKTPSMFRTLARGKRELVNVSLRAAVSANASVDTKNIAALDLETGSDTLAPGAPLLDASGDVAGMVITVCAATMDESCAPWVVGLGVDEIRQALKPTTTPLPPLPGAPMRLERAGKTLPIRGLRVTAIPEWLTPYGVRVDDVIFAARAEIVTDPKRLEAIVKDADGKAGLLAFRGGKYVRLHGRVNERPVPSLPLENEIVSVFGQRVESDTIAAVRVSHTRPLARSSAGIQSGDLLLAIDERPALTHATGSRALVLRAGRLIELHLRRRITIDLATTQN